MTLEKLGRDGPPRLRRHVVMMAAASGAHRPREGKGNGKRGGGVVQRSAHVHLAGEVTWCIILWRCQETGGGSLVTRKGSWRRPSPLVAAPETVAR